MYGFRVGDDVGDVQISGRVGSVTGGTGIKSGREGLKPPLVGYGSKPPLVGMIGSKLPLVGSNSGRKVGIRSNPPF